MAGASDRRRPAPATLPVDRTGPMRPEPATPGDSVAGLELPQAATSELRRRLTGRVVTPRLGRARDPRESRRNTWIFRFGFDALA